MVGTAAEIKALYRAMLKASRRVNYDKCCGITTLYPTFSGFPKFNPESMYGVIIEDNNEFSIVGEHSLMRMIVLDY